ncbi:MAG: hypothetical protein US74_C0016G0012 [Parcubacteria group bacterium GW2011_GWA2_38_13]|nr:MAG: hypothetical protein US74_C0016G0012 [Parcubacteria group bacterium GW2011_GWA2_38_13]
MSFQEVCSAIAFVTCMIAFIPYGIAIVRKIARPSKATWIIWACLDTITFVGMYIKHALNGQIIGAVAGVWIIVALALKYGEPGWKLLDKFCLGGAVLGIALWIVFNSPIVGILTSLSIVFLGSIPTFVSAWKDPSREDKLAWTIYFASCIFTMFGIQNWTLEETAQPITFLVDETVMVYILYFHKKPVYLEISILEK